MVVNRHFCLLIVLGGLIILVVSIVLPWPPHHACYHDLGPTVLPAIVLVLPYLLLLFGSYQFSLLIKVAIIVLARGHTPPLSFLRDCA